MAVAGRTGEYFDELETMSPAARESYFGRRLPETIDNAYHHAPAVREMLDRARVRPGDIRTVKDLEKIPITRKTDLMDREKANPPYGGFVTVPYEDIERVFLSPGPIYEPIQGSNINWFAKAFWAAGFRKGDIVINTFSYHMSPGGILFHEALRECGATAIPTGTGNTDIQIQTMRDLKVTGVVSTPSFLTTLIKRAEEMGLNMGRDILVKKAWFTGEMLPPALRKTFEEVYHIETSQAYAVAETGGALAYECHEKSGMHFMDEYVIEVVDPATGKQLGPGETGEVVVTPVHNKVWGLIRFGTGDLSSYITEPCPCGRTSNRLTNILGRSGDAVKVRGLFVVGRQVEQVLAGFEPVSRFQLVVTRREVRDEMTLKVELRQDIPVDARSSLAEEINTKFQGTCRLKLDDIDFLAPGTLPAQYQKMVDERKWV